MTRPLYIYFISQNRSHSAGPVSLVLNNEDVFDELELEIELSVESRNK